MTLEKRVHNGSRAREVLENEAFDAAFTAIEEDLIDQWKNSPARDEEGREKLWSYLKLLHRLKAQLTDTMDSGRLAALDLEHKRNLLQRAGDWLSS